MPTYLIPINVMRDNYLDSVRKQFEDCKRVADKTFEQVSDDKLRFTYNENSNSIATLVKHLSGNMISRWTNFLTTDGEKGWRNRDSEFENDIEKRRELLEIWAEGWNCLFRELNVLDPEDLDKIVFIRNQRHTVVEAINR
jgi:hypothetical protein